MKAVSDDISERSTYLSRILNELRTINGNVEKPPGVGLQKHLVLLPTNRSSRHLVGLDITAVPKWDIDGTRWLISGSCISLDSRPSFEGRRSLVECFLFRIGASSVVRQAGRGFPFILTTRSTATTVVMLRASRQCIRCIQEIWNIAFIGVRG